MKMVSDGLSGDTGRVQFLGAFPGEGLNSQVDGHRQEHLLWNPGEPVGSVVFRYET